MKQKSDARRFLAALLALCFAGAATAQAWTAKPV
jgi:hypothetical protein